MQSANRQIKVGALLSYLAIILNIGSGLLYTPWMVKMIGQSQYGLYTLANSLISLFLVDFGLSSATARYVSKYHAENSEEKVHNFLGVVYKLYLFIDAVIFVALIIVFIFIDTIYKNLTPAELSQFKIVYIIAGLFSVVNFPFVTLNGIMTAYEEFVHLKLADVIYRVLLVTVMIAVLLNGGNLYALVTVNACVGLLVIVYKLLIIRIKIPIKVNIRYWSHSLAKELFGFSTWTMISALAQRLVFSITPSILGIVSSSVEIAVFGIISTIEGYVFTFTTAINGMFMPTISRAYSNDNSGKQLYPLFLRVGKFQYAINGLIVTGFLAIGKQFVDLWMGSGYRTAYYGILLIIIPGLFYNALQIANTALVVTNKVKYQAYINLVMGILNIVLSFPLAKTFGAEGACIAIFVSFMVRNVILHTVCYKILHLNIFGFVVDCYLRMSIPIIATTVFGYLINLLILPKGWIDFCLRGVAIVTFFFIILLSVGVSKEDRDEIRKRLRGG